MFDLGNSFTVSYSVNIDIYVDIFLLFDGRFLIKT